MSKNDVLAYNMTSKVQPWYYPTAPRSAQFYSYCRPPDAGRGLNRLWSAVRCGAGQDSNQFPVSGHTECRRQQALSWVHSLASKWTDGTAPLWANFRNQQPLYSGNTEHTSYTLHGTGFFNLDFIHQSLAIGPKVRSSFTSPGSWCAPQLPVHLGLKFSQELYKKCPLLQKQLLSSYCTTNFATF